MNYMSENRKKIFLEQLHQINLIISVNIERSAIADKLLPQTIYASFTINSQVETFLLLSQTFFDIYSILSNNIS